jgi:hypothetical protein
LALIHHPGLQGARHANTTQTDQPHSRGRGMLAHWSTWALRPIPRYILDAIGRNDLRGTFSSELQSTRSKLTVA